MFADSNRMWFELLGCLQDSRPDLFVPNDTTWAFAALDSVGYDRNVQATALEALGS